MATYRLRLFGRDGWSNRTLVGVLAFRARDAASAAAKARKLFPQLLDDCSYALLYDEEGVLIWRKGEERSNWVRRQVVLGAAADDPHRNPST